MPKAQNSRVIQDGVSAPASALKSAQSKDLRAVRSAGLLRDALLALLLEKSFDQITVRDICAQAKVHYATFFRHHQTKESLLNEIAADQIRHLIELTMAIREPQNYEPGFRALCQYVADHRTLWAILLNGGAGSTMREEWLRQSQRVAQTEAPVNSWMPTDLGTICAATLIAETLAWWVSKPESAYSVDEVAGLLYRLLSSSIMAPD